MSGVRFHVMGVRADYAAALRARLVENARVVGRRWRTKAAAPMH